MAKKARRRGKGLRGLAQPGLSTGWARDLVPPAVGVGLSLATTIGIRSAITPLPGTTSAAVYRWAPAIGAGAGVLGGLAMFLLGGAAQAASTTMTSLITSGALFLVERIHTKKPGAFDALVGQPTLAAGDAVAGLRAIVPEYSGNAFRGIGSGGLGAIVMEQLKGNQQGQGESVQLRGVVNTGAFGSSPFSA